MVDLHSHIIYGIDDGSKSKEMTLNMLRKSVETGTRKIVATPHFFPGRYEVKSGDVKEYVKELNALTKENDINIEIYSGQEVYYTENILKYYNEGLIGTINNTRYMLIELPMRNFSRTNVINDIYELQIKGIIPIIAHPERYKPFIEEPRLINKLIREGFLFQLNTGSITGMFGKNAKKTANIFLKNRVYSFIGSDAHRDVKRNTDMSLGLESINKIDKKYLSEINRWSEDMLLNKDVEFGGNIIEKKKNFILRLFSR